MFTNKRTFFSQNMTKPIVIFDIDGTLADIVHRKHFIEEKKPDWRSFNESARVDPPIKATFVILLSFIKLGAFDIRFVTGRSIEYKPILLTWLNEQTGIPEKWFNDKIIMRQRNDHRADNIVKEEWLLSLTQEERNRILMVFEDRDRVVEMWRSHGIQCYQVQKGDY